MRKTKTTVRMRPIIALSTMVALVAGCAQTEDWLRRLRTPTSSESAIAAIPSADVYLKELHDLATGDPYTQVEIHADAASAALLTPGPSTELRLALILATPGHAETDPKQAQSMLREILTRPELLTATEIALATITLKSVEDRLTLDAESRRLRSENARARTTESQALGQRIAAIEAENRNLKEQLSEAEAKLEAIMLIERSIREQTDNPD